MFWFRRLPRLILLYLLPYLKRLKVYHRDTNRNISGIPKALVDFLVKKKAHVMKLSELELEAVKAAKDIAQELIPVSIDLGTTAALGTIVLLKDVLRTEVELLRRPEIQPYLNLIQLLGEAARRKERETA